METNRLALNISKTSLSLFYSPSKKINDFIRIRLGRKTITQLDHVKYLGILVDPTLSWKPEIRLGRKTITQLNHVKYLGILVDSTLSWKPDVTELSKKLARNCGIFYKSGILLRQTP